MANSKYGLTYDEIAQVAVAHVTQIHAAVFLCANCGVVKLAVSRDMGITPAWLPAANVIGRLRHGQVIDGPKSLLKARDL